jgi:hypothetical protein
MKDVEAFIWHDEHGSIVAVGHVPADRKESIEPKTRPGHQVLRLSLEEDQLSTLHLTHSVDVERGILRPRDAGMRSD